MSTPVGRLLCYGGDYNPEQWPEQVWSEDVQLMTEAGVNLVTVGVFAWAQLEPRPGEYQLGWLDRVLDLLHAAGIAVDLATATASPPPWLARLDPSSLPVRADGVRLWPGSRQAYCPSAPRYRERALALVDRIAARYGSHPALALWHVGNEFGAHVAECHCDVSAQRFRDWLRTRYADDLGAVNDAWATAVWSQRYADWSEIWTPRATPSFANPSQLLDWRRFCSSELLGQFRAERDVLRQHCAEVPVTTNFMGCFAPLDYWQWAAEEDIVSHDGYPDPADPQAHVDAALAADLMRGLGGGRPWLLMEQTPSRVSWHRWSVPKRPGQLRLWSLQAVARGADGVLYFQWRQPRAGAEKWHSAVVGHAGSPVVEPAAEPAAGRRAGAAATTSRSGTAQPPSSADPNPSGATSQRLDRLRGSAVWREVSELGAELAELSDVVGSRVTTAVAIVFSWESWWALDCQPSAELDYYREVRRCYQTLWEANVTVDLVRPGASLADYRLVFLPSLYLLDDTAADAVKSFVERGGTAVVGCWSGVVDEHDHVRLGGCPGALRELLGVWVEDYAPLADGQTATIRLADGSEHPVRLWTERLVSEGAEVLASYVGGDLHGRPAVTRHGFGAGAAYYLSAPLPGPALAVLRDRVTTEAAVAPVLPDLPAGIEAVRRGGRTFLLNHTESWVDLAISGQPARLAPRGARVLPADAGG